MLGRGRDRDRDRRLVYCEVSIASLIASAMIRCWSGSHAGEKDKG
jgi:hypothetical protein